MSEQFTFFLKGPLSQWHPSGFVDVMGTEYSCAEQYMMSAKALLFKDQESYDLIMAAKHPREQKRLGRLVKNFDADQWNEAARNVVYIANYFKFTQNPELEAVLLGTIGTLVECNPRDRIWGIGLSEGDEKTFSRDTWNGTNWLGEVLTELRDDLTSKLFGAV